MPTPIPEEALASIRAMPQLCANDWLAQPGRTYEDLAEKPEWILVAARLKHGEGSRFPDLDKLIDVAISLPIEVGADIRRRFARYNKRINQSQKDRLLAGLDPG